MERCTETMQAIVDLSKSKVVTRWKRVDPMPDLAGQVDMLFKRANFKMVSLDLSCHLRAQLLALQHISQESRWQMLVRVWAGPSLADPTRSKKMALSTGEHPMKVESQTLFSTWITSKKAVVLIQTWVCWRNERLHLLKVKLKEMSQSWTRLPQKKARIEPLQVSCSASNSYVPKEALTTNSVKQELTFWTRMPLSTILCPRHPNDFTKPWRVLIKSGPQIWWTQATWRFASESISENKTTRAPWSTLESQERRQ